MPPIRPATPLYGDGPIVAASNTPTRRRARADYLADASNASTAIQAAITAAGPDQPVHLLPGYYVLEDTLTPKAGTILLGSSRGALSTVSPGTYNVHLSWQGAGDEHAIEWDGASELSRLEIGGFRLTDDRSAPTSGCGISLKRVKNRVKLHDMLIGAFATDAVYVGADSGQSSDCVELTDLWVEGDRYGINVERLDNAVIIHNIKGDSYDGLSSMEALIRVASIGAVPASGAVHISDVKHECTNGANTILVPDSATSGALLLENIIMRSPILSGGGFVLRISAGDGTGIVAVNLAHDGTAAGVIRNVANDYTVTTNPLPFWAGGGRGIGINAARIYGTTGGGTNPQLINVTAAKTLLSGGLGVGNSASASTLGTVTKKIEVFDASGNSLGFVPVYDGIT